MRYYTSRRDHLTDWLLTVGWRVGVAIAGAFLFVLVALALAAGW